MFNIFQNIPAVLSPLIVIIALFAVAGIAFLVGLVSGRAEGAELYKRSKRQSRSVLGGIFSEQVAPFLPGFPEDLKASEARFIGKPIDFLIFKGMDEQDIREVVFVEIKSGTSQLSTNERKLRDVIKEKKVRWEEYRVDGEITKISEESVSSLPRQ